MESQFIKKYAFRSICENPEKKTVNFRSCKLFKAYVCQYVELTHPLNSSNSCIWALLARVTSHLLYFWSKQQGSQGRRPKWWRHILEPATCGWTIFLFLYEVMTAESSNNLSPSLLTTFTCQTALFDALLCCTLCVVVTSAATHVLKSTRTGKLPLAEVSWL
jgi:hypothetical protein